MFAALKAVCLGYRGVGSQIDRIEEGFRAEGCEVVTDTRAADLIYCNDSGYYQQVIDAKARGDVHPNAKVIFNCLDLCPHCVDFPLARVGTQLKAADAITTISQTVQRDIRSRLGVEATVVYNPIRLNSSLQRAGPRGFPLALFVGRVNDPEKRAGIGAAALSILGYGWNDMATIGREPPHYGGTYIGEADDQMLTLAYHLSTFLMCPTRHAFLGLPILEAMACGTIPVICNDLDVREEFLPSSVFPEYRAIEASAPSIATFVGHLMNNDEARKELQGRLYQHFQSKWAHHLSPRGVAEKILTCYQSIA